LLSRRSARGPNLGARLPHLRRECAKRAAEWPPRLQRHAAQPVLLQHRGVRHAHAEREGRLVEERALGKPVKLGGAKVARAQPSRPALLAA